MSRRGRSRIPAWRGDLLAPDAARTGWLGRTGGRAKNHKQEEEQAEPATPLAATVQLPPAPMPPPPDAPGPKGGLLDFLEGLRKKPGIDVPAFSPPVAGKSPPAAAPTIKIEAVTPPAAVLKKKSQSKRPIPKERALVVVKSPPRARPRRLKGSRPSLFPIVFKLLVGVGVASAAVAMQDRFPQFESRGSAVTTGITTGTTNPVHVAQQPAPPVLVTPIAEIEAHRGSISGAAYSEDGRRIVTTGADGTMKVWDAQYRNLVRTIELDDGPATALAVSGSRALTGHANGKVVLWNIDLAEKLTTVQRNDANIWAVCFTDTPDRFAAASHDWKVTLWDARQPSAPLQVLEGHENAVQSLAYAPQQLLLASGSADKTVRVWSLDTLTLKRAYKGQRDFVTSVSFSPSGKLLAAGALDGRIQIWSVVSSRRMRALSGHRGRVADLAFSPSGDELASAGEDGTVRLWDLRRGRIIRALTGHVGGATAVAFSPDGQHLVSAGVDGRVRLWSIPLGQMAQE